MRNIPGLLPVMRQSSMPRDYFMKTVPYGPDRVGSCHDFRPDRAQDLWRISVAQQSEPIRLVPSG